MQRRAKHAIMNRACFAPPKLLCSARSPQMPLLEKLEQAASRAHLRATRRKSAWNLLLLVNAFLFTGLIWFAFVRLAWAIHIHFYPAHQFADFWRANIGIRAFGLSFVMMFAPAPGALISGFIISNFVSYLIPSGRRALDREAQNHPGTDFRASMRALFRIWRWILPAGLVLSFGAARLLSSLY
jgi:hypothetical protein